MITSWHVLQTSVFLSVLPSETDGVVREMGLYVSNRNLYIYPEVGPKTYRWHQ